MHNAAALVSYLANDARILVDKHLGRRGKGARLIDDLGGQHGREWAHDPRPRRRRRRRKKWRHGLSAYFSTALFGFFHVLCRNFVKYL